MSNTILLSKQELGRDISSFHISRVDGKNLLLAVRRNTLDMRVNKKQLQISYPYGLIKSAEILGNKYIVFTINNILRVMDIKSRSVIDRTFNGFIRVQKAEIPTVQGYHLYVIENEKLYLVEVRENKIVIKSNISLDSIISDICLLNENLYVFTYDAKVHVLTFDLKLLNERQIGLVAEKVAKRDDKTIYVVTRDSIYVLDTSDFHIEELFKDLNIKDFVVSDINNDKVNEIIFVDGKYLGMIQNNIVTTINQAPDSRFIEFYDVDSDGVNEFHIVDNKGTLTILKPADYYAYSMAVANERYDIASRILLKNRKLLEELLTKNKIHDVVLSYLYANNIEIPLEKALKGFPIVRDMKIIEMFIDRAFKENLKLLLKELPRLNEKQIECTFFKKPILILDKYFEVRSKLSNNTKRRVLNLINKFDQQRRIAFLNKLISDEIILIWDIINAEDKNKLERKIWEEILIKRPDLAVESPYLDLRVIAYVKLNKYDKAYNVIKEDLNVLKQIEEKVPDAFLVYLLDNGILISNLKRVLPKIKNNFKILSFITERNPAFIKEHLDQIELGDKEYAKILDALHSKIRLNATDVLKLPRKGVILLTNLNPREKFFLLYPYINELSHTELYTLWKEIDNSLKLQINWKLLFEAAVKLEKEDLLYWLGSKYVDSVLSNFMKLPEKFKEKMLIYLLELGYIRRIESYIPIDVIQEYSMLWKLISQKHPDFVIRHAKELKFEPLVVAVEIMNVESARRLLSIFDPKKALSIILGSEDEEAFENEEIISKRINLWTKIPLDYYESITEISPKFVIKSGMPAYYKFKANYLLDDYPGCAKVVMETIMNFDEENLNKIIELSNTIETWKLIEISISVRQDEEERYYNDYLSKLDYEVRKQLITRFIDHYSDYYLIPLERKSVARVLIVPKEYEVKKIENLPKDAVKIEDTEGGAIYHKKKEIYIISYDIESIHLDETIYKIKIGKIEGIDIYTGHIKVKTKKKNIRFTVENILIPTIRTAAVVIDLVEYMLNRKPELLRMMLSFGGEITLRAIKWSANKLRKEPDWIKQFIEVLKEKKYPWDAERVIEVYKKSKKEKKLEAVIRELEIYT